MIVRVFRAIVHDGKQEEFKNFFLNTAKPFVSSHDGLESLFIGTPSYETPCEFLMVMHWKDVESIKNFAGENWTKAVIHDDEKDLLKEVHVHHYEYAE